MQDVFVLRKIEEKDIEFIFHLRQISKTDSLKETTRKENQIYLESLIQSNTNNYFCYECDNYIIGYQRYFNQNGKIYVGSLVTNPIANMIEKVNFDFDLKYAIFNKENVAELFFNVRTSNRNVWKFHEFVGAKLIKEENFERTYVLNYDHFLKSYNSFKKRINSSKVASTSFRKY